MLSASESIKQMGSDCGLREKTHLNYVSLKLIIESGVPSVIGCFVDH